LLDETVALWKGKVSKENEPSRLEGHSLGIVDVKFYNNSLLAVSSLDSVIRIWDLEKSIKR
jgi:WD40 repeat protein